MSFINRMLHLVLSLHLTEILASY